MMEKEKMAPARMYVDEEGRLRVESEELESAVTIKAPEPARFEFVEPFKDGLDLSTLVVAKLKHGGGLLAGSKTDRAWEFHLVVEDCECRLLSSKSRKQQAIETSIRSVGFAQDGSGRKVVVFKEDGRMSPIFEFALPDGQCLVAKGPGAIAAPAVADAIARLAPADAMNWVAPALRQASSTSDEVDLLGMGDVDPTVSGMHQ
mmetsp:Transcript_21416/g.85186  ORF Transcript_21416/g.85186 Transcript_21416/m.85186 type:complete len:203 (+) Transcript_21416:324-932(+)